MVYFFVFIAGFKILLKGRNLMGKLLDKLGEKYFHNGGFGACFQLKVEDKKYCMKCIKDDSIEQSTEAYY